MKKNSQPAYDLKWWRERWNRWLGAKTRANDQEWTNLLDCKWTGWAYSVDGVRFEKQSWQMTRAEIKKLLKHAITQATLEDFHRLDGIFLEDQMKRRDKRR